MNGQRSDGYQLVAALFYSFALEGQLGIFLDIEKVGAAQVFVAVLVVGVNGRRLDVRLHRGLIDVLFVVIDHAGHIAETPSRVADHHVADSEAGERVGGIDVVLLGKAGDAREHREHHKERDCEFAHGFS